MIGFRQRLVQSLRIGGVRRFSRTFVPRSIRSEGDALAQDRLSSTRNILEVKQPASNGNKEGPDSTDEVEKPRNTVPEDPPFQVKNIKAPLLNSQRVIMEQYLSSKHFSFPVDRHERSMTRLREYMELVYTKERPLVSIDVEAWEKSLSKVTEIGIVVYDPEESQGSLLPIIKPIHIVVREHLKRLNGKFVPDNKHRYMGGTSYVLSYSESRDLVEQIIKKYIIEKNGVLVGHNIEGDIKWIKSLGVELPDNVPTVDTLKLYSISRSTGGTLRGVLRLAEIPHAILHNAANDAYYTLLAAMTYCDPELRTQKSLDVFQEPVPKSKFDKRLEKFSDNARLVSSDGELFSRFENQK